MHQAQVALHGSSEEQRCSRTSSGGEWAQPAAHGSAGSYPSQRASSSGLVVFPSDESAMDLAAGRCVCRCLRGLHPCSVRWLSMACIHVGRSGKLCAFLGCSAWCNGTRHTSLHWGMGNKAVRRHRNFRGLSQPGPIISYHPIPKIGGHSFWHDCLRVQAGHVRQGQPPQPSAMQQGGSASPSFRRAGSRQGHYALPVADAVEVAISGALDAMDAARAKVRQGGESQPHQKACQGRAAGAHVHHTTILHL